MLGRLWLRLNRGRFRIDYTGVCAGNQLLARESETRVAFLSASSDHAQQSSEIFPVAAGL